MASSHEHERERLARIFEDLGRNSGASLRAAAAPELTWWLPMGSSEPGSSGPGASEHRGVTDVEHILVSTLADKGAEVQSVILSDGDGDGDGSAVIEQLLRGVDGDPTPATSVLTLRAGLIIAGRTYLDVAAWGAVAEAGHHG